MGGKEAFFDLRERQGLDLSRVRAWATRRDPTPSGAALPDGPRSRASGPVVGQGAHVGALAAAQPEIEPGRPKRVNSQLITRMKRGSRSTSSPLRAIL